MTLVLGGILKQRETRLIIAVKLKTNPHPLQLRGEKKHSREVFPDEILRDLVCPYCAGTPEIFETSRTSKSFEQIVLELDYGMQR